jgi:hypothetical protein
MTANEFRRLALAIPGAIESSHMDHPDFRLDGKIFATLGVPDEEWGMVNLTLEEQRAFMAEVPGVFKPCSGVWGERGATHVHLPTVTPKLAKAALAVAKDKVSKPRRKAKP